MDYDKLYHDVKKRYDALVRLHDAVNKRVVTLERELGLAKQAVQLVKVQREQMDQQKTLQDIVIAQQLQSVNDMNNRYLVENGKLKDKVKELTNGDNC